MTEAVRHELKIWPIYFDKVLLGTKTFEARRNDRGFKVGDILVLREWDKEIEGYTGREIEREITYMLSGPGFGVESGFCIMALNIVEIAFVRGWKAGSEALEAQVLEAADTLCANCCEKTKIVAEMTMPIQPKEERA